MQCIGTNRIRQFNKISSNNNTGKVNGRDDAEDTVVVVKRENHCQRKNNTITPPDPIKLKLNGTVNSASGPVTPLSSPKSSSSSPTTATIVNNHSNDVDRIPKIVGKLGNMEANANYKQLSGMFRLLEAVLLNEYFSAADHCYSSDWKDLYINRVDSSETEGRLLVIVTRK